MTSEVLPALMYDDSASDLIFTLPSYVRAPGVWSCPWDPAPFLSKVLPVVFTFLATPVSVSACPRA